MLIEFKVSNYRSFNEEVVFSMAAATRLRKHKANTQTIKLKDDVLPPLLKTAVIYGPNASGKSNFVRALRVLHDIFILSDAERAAFNVQPFRLNVGVDEVSKFCISFIYDELRYEFGLWVSSQRVVKESLKSYPLGEETMLYERTWNANSRQDDYVYGFSLEGGAELHKIWSSLVSSKALFFKQAAANSIDTFQQLKKPLNWFTKELFVTGIDSMESLRSTAKKILQQIPDRGHMTANLMSAVDIPIENIKIKTFQLPEDKTHTQTIFTHLFDGKSFDFDFEDESEGTKNLFALAPLWNLSKDCFKVFIFDEFDSSLHPTIVAKLIEQQCKNPEGSQFIFTTHDTHLMDAKVLRRDQFWLTERNRQGASTLTSIYEYEGREGEDIEKRYYEGRYRALPILS